MRTSSAVSWDMAAGKGSHALGYISVSIRRRVRVQRLSSAVLERLPSMSYESMLMAILEYTLVGCLEQRLIKLASDMLQHGGPVKQQASRR